MKTQHAVQNLVFNMDGTLPEELFCRGDFRYDDGKLMLEEGKAVSFDTYFNMFFASQWKELTKIEKVCFLLKLQGTGRVQIWRTDSRGIGKILEEIPFSLEQETDFLAGKSNSLKKLGQACWLKLIADKGTVSLRDGSIVTETEPAQDLNLACCFCT